MRLYKDHKRRNEDHEFVLAIERIKIADFRNANRGRNTAPIMPQDIFKLSYDTVLKQEVDPDLFNKVARRLGSMIKKKNENANE